MTGAHTYGAYGEANALERVARAAYGGEVMESDTGWYVLGNRLYSPALRRFLGPDPESPFHDGGFNRYAYCSGDPISRIDPTGNAWTDWLASGLMVALSVVGSIISAGALAAPLGAASTAVATAAAGGAGVAGAVSAGASVAIATPGIVATATAAVMDAVSTVAAIGSVASIATHNQKANSIFGWIAMGTGVTSGLATITASKQVARASARTTGGSRGAFTGTAASGRTSNTATPHATVSALKAATPVVTSSASTRANHRSSTRGLVASDLNGGLPQIRQVAARLLANGDKEATVYFNAPHRKAFRNPHGTPRSASRGLYRDDLGMIRRTGSSAGLQTDAVDMTTLTREQTRQRMSEDGIHMVVTGHGLVDDTIMRSLNMPDAVSDHLQPVRAGP